MELPADLPYYISLLFILSAAFCLILVYWSIKGTPSLKKKSIAAKVTVGLLVWGLIQMTLTKMAVYNTGMTVMPPKILLFGVLPTFLFITYVFISRSGKTFIDSLPLNRIMIIHIVRIPVEFGLYYLFISKTIPEIMTFSGYNFDILAGLTAPFIIYFGLQREMLKRRFILFWNIVCLILLINIIILAILSAPSPFQQFGIEQPNIAIFNFPFSWLPTLIVPLVIFMHLVTIRQLVNQHEK